MTFHSSRHAIVAVLVALGLLGLGAQADDNIIQRENRQPGATDWQLTRVRADADGFRSPWIEGYCSKQSVEAGESIDIMVSTDPPRPFTIEIFRMGYYGGRGARLMKTLGPLDGKAQPVPKPGPKNLHECRWEPSTQLTIPDDWPSGVYLGRLTTVPEGDERTLLAELRRLHRPRRPPRRHPLPVLRQHLAGLQPLAEQLFRLHPSRRGFKAPGPTSASTALTAARRSTRGSSTTRSRSARASSCRWNSRSPTGWSSTATTSPTARTATCSRPITGSSARRSSASGTTSTGTSGSSAASRRCATRG